MELDAAASSRVGCARDRARCLVRTTLALNELAKRKAFEDLLRM